MQSVSVPPPSWRTVALVLGVGAVVVVLVCVLSWGFHLKGWAHKADTGGAGGSGLGPGMDDGPDRGVDNFPSVGGNEVYPPGPPTGLQAVPLCGTVFSISCELPPTADIVAIMGVHAFQPGDPCPLQMPNDAELYLTSRAKAPWSVNVPHPGAYCLYAQSTQDIQSHGTEVIGGISGITNAVSTAGTSCAGSGSVPPPTVSLIMTYTPPTVDGEAPFLTASCLPATINTCNWSMTWWMSTEDPSDPGNPGSTGQSFAGPASWLSNQVIPIEVSNWYWFTVDCVAVGCGDGGYPPCPFKPIGVSTPQYITVSVAPTPPPPNKYALYVACVATGPGLAAQLMAQCIPPQSGPKLTLTWWKISSSNGSGQPDPSKDSQLTSGPWGSTNTFIPSVAGLIYLAGQPSPQSDPTYSDINATYLLEVSYSATAGAAQITVDTGYPTVPVPTSAYVIWYKMTGATPNPALDTNVLSGYVTRTINNASTLTSPSPGSYYVVSANLQVYWTPTQQQVYVDLTSNVITVGS